VQRYKKGKILGSRRQEGKVSNNTEILRARLENEKKRLKEQMAHLKANHPVEDRREGSPFGKREEEAAEAAELENRLVLQKRILDQMAEVDYALIKFDNKTYGLCEKCGQSISPERLEALPQARLCLSCKAKQAKNAKG
jgi:DnaK suppressor protein